MRLPWARKPELPDDYFYPVLPLDQKDAQAMCHHEWYFGHCWKCDAAEYTNMRVALDEQTGRLVWSYDESVGQGVIA